MKELSFKQLFTKTPKTPKMADFKAWSHSVRKANLLTLVESIVKTGHGGKDGVRSTEYGVRSAECGVCL